MLSYAVHARWDQDSKTWWTDGEDIPVLCCQASSLEELIEAIVGMAGELLRDNGAATPDQPVDIAIAAERHARTRVAA